MRRFDDHRRAAGVHLVSRQVGQVFNDGFVDESRATIPGVFGQGIRYHRDETEIVVLLLPFSGELSHVQVGRTAASPVKHHLARGAHLECVLGDALDRGEAGTAGYQDHRFVRILAHEECAQGTFKTQDVFFLHLAEDRLGECAICHVAHVQFDIFVVMRRISHRIGAALAVLHEDVDVLPGEKLDAFVCRQLQLQDDDVGRDPAHFLHPAGQFADVELADAADLARFDDQVRQRPGLAEQRRPRFLFELRQNIGLWIAIVHAALENFALARPAGAVAASVGKRKAFAQRCGKHGFVVTAGENVVAGFDCYLMGHNVDTLPRPNGVRVKINA